MFTELFSLRFSSVVKSRETEGEWPGRLLCRWRRRDACLYQLIVQLIDHHRIRAAMAVRSNGFPLDQQRH